MTCLRVSEGASCRTPPWTWPPQGNPAGARIRHWISAQPLTWNTTSVQCYLTTEGLWGQSWPVLFGYWNPTQSQCYFQGSWLKLTIPYQRLVFNYHTRTHTHPPHPPHHYTHTCTHTHTHTCMHARTHTYAHTHPHTHTHTCAHTQMHTDKEYPNQWLNQSGQSFSLDKGCWKVRLEVWPDGALRR